MALGLDDALEGAAVLAGVGLGIIGIGMVAPKAGKALRPVAKRAVAGYLVLQDRVKESTAEAREQWSDLVAEVRSERGGEAETNGREGESQPATA